MLSQALISKFKNRNYQIGVIVIENYKPICFTYYNPSRIFKSGKNARERVSVYKCSNCENCNAYKKKKCVMLNGIWGHSCPYGTIEKKVLQKQHVNADI